MNPAREQLAAPTILQRRDLRAGFSHSQESTVPSAHDHLPATTVAAVRMLAQANCTIQDLTKALAHLGCSCVVKTRETDIEAHQTFCRYRSKIEDMGGITI